MTEFTVAPDEKYALSEIAYQLATQLSELNGRLGDIGETLYEMYMFQKAVARGKGEIK